MKGGDYINDSIKPNYLDNTNDNKNNKNMDENVKNYSHENIIIKPKMIIKLDEKTNSATNLGFSFDKNK